MEGKRTELLSSCIPLMGECREQEGMRTLRKQTAALSFFGACQPFFQQQKAPGKVTSGSNAAPLPGTAHVTGDVTGVQEMQTA